jgi:hypothetical protein
MIFLAGNVKQKNLNRNLRNNNPKPVKAERLGSNMHEESQHIHGHFDFKIHGGFFHMTQVSGSFSVKVSAAAPPPAQLAITPSSGALPDETEGVAIVSDAVAKVTGGVPPYTYSVTGLPAGVNAVETVNADGSADVTLSGTPSPGDAALSPYTVSVVVTDSATAAAARATRTLNVR